MVLLPAGDLVCPVTRGEEAGLGLLTTGRLLDDVGLDGLTGAGLTWG